MIFDSLSSEVIKASLVSKLAFSLGFKMISTTLKAEQQHKEVAKGAVITKFEDGTHDHSVDEAAEIAKRRWCTYTDWAETNGYNHSSIEEIAESYVKSSGKPIVKATDEILKLRASISGQSVEALKKAADKLTEVTQAKVQYRIDAIISELSDVKSYANAWYNNDKEDYQGALVHSSCDIEEILTKEWVETNYPVAMQSQIKYWSTYNNWDDAELVMIAADKQLLGL